MQHEVRHAFRRLVRAPAFTSFAVLTLAIGIGAVTAIYSVTYAVLFRPLDIRELDRVVNIYHSNPRAGGPGHYISMSWPDLVQVRVRQDVFSDVVAWSRVMQPLVRNGEFRLAIGEVVEGHYFDFVGAAPALGRTLQPPDDEAGAPMVAVLSDRMWRRDFNADPDVVGATLRLGDAALQIVGVMPASYRGVDMPNVIPTEFWAPLRTIDQLTEPGRDRWIDPEDRWVMVKARLAPGRSAGEARAQVQAIGRALDEGAPIGTAEGRVQGSPTSVRRYHVMPAADLRAHESVDAFAMPVAVAVLGAVGLVLLVACTNLANLLLARGASRTHEVAVRRALGASRTRLVGELTVDSLLLAVAGGGAGLLLSLWLMHLLSGSVAMGRGLSISVAPRLDASVLLVTLAALGVSILVFGLLPAWHSTRPALRSVLDQQTGGAVARWRSRRLLIAAQVAVSVALLVAASVFLRQMWVKALHDPGFDLERIAASQLDFAFGEYDADRTRELLHRALDELRRDPAIERAALVNRLPIYFTGSGAGRYVGPRPLVVDSPEAARAARAEGRLASALVGSADVVEALGLRLEGGRGFDEVEASSTAPVVVISRTIAQRTFGATDVVGRTIYVGTEPREIIGVVADTDWTRLGARDAGLLVEPGLPDLSRSAVLVARARRDPGIAMVNLRETLRRLDPALPVVETTTGEAIVAQEMLVEQIGSRVVAALGAFALLLALIGLSGLLSYLVASRRREIGLRMALGADRRRVVRLVLSGGLRPVVFGALVGLGAGAALSAFVGFSFYRREPFDWTGLVAVPLVLLPAAVLACYLPARRAARVDPNVALREL